MRSQLRTLDHAKIKGQKVFLRVDYNVPLRNGNVGEISRIEATLPTIKELIEKGAQIALFSHLGRPEGESKKEFSLRPLVDVLQHYFPNNPIVFNEDYFVQNRSAFWQNCPLNGIVLAENLRFSPLEEKNDPRFSLHLAQFCDLVVNDAFATCHRAHASIVGITHFLPSFAGRLLEKELNALNSYYSLAQKPIIALIGGAKISTKIEVLKNILSQVDCLIIAGGMANTFLLAKGFSIGKSLAEPLYCGVAQEIISLCEKKNKQIILPVDCIVAEKLTENSSSQIVTIDNIPENKMILDIGPQTIKVFKEQFAKGQTILWNGPLGAFEIEPFDKGTNECAQEIAKLTQEHKLVSLTGGGDSVAALSKLNLENDFSYVSTGGGAFLEWLEGKTLPGLQVLYDPQPPSSEKCFGEG